MTPEEERSALLDVAYLASCAVNELIPDSTRISQMDLSALYHAADRHLLTGITAMALESAGVKDEAFTQAKGKAIRKVAAFDVERVVILAEFEDAGIWYMPLKGSVLKALYPRIGMRQMSDNDILIDGDRMLDAQEIMEGLGFALDHHGAVHDTYKKQPIYNFELHRALFSKAADKRIRSYYLDIKTRLIKDSDNQYGYHLSDEDFYVYQIAHEFKHFSYSGTGLRSLLDTYVYISSKGDDLDWSYIAAELDKMGIASFEEQNRSLATRLFGNGPLSHDDQEMLDYILSSGTYGTINNRVSNKVSQLGDGPLGKVRYVLSRAIMPIGTVRVVFPVFARYPILLPFLPFYRVFRGLTVRRAVMLQELRALAAHKSRKGQQKR